MDPNKKFPRLMPIKENTGYREPDKWVWCGSAVEEPGKGFHLYAARWRKDYPMLEGYVLFSEIVHAFSEKLEGPYRFVEKVLPCYPDPNWDSRMAHNPTVVKRNGEYLLYYIGTTYDEPPTPPDVIQKDRSMMLRAYDRICIGLARSKSPAGPWQVLPRPVLEPRPGKFDSAIVTNPAPCVLPDGRIYLYYRTNAPKGTRIGLAVYETPDGPARRFDEPILPADFQIEDPFVWHNGKHFEMLAKDLNGKSTGEYHSGAHFVSEDGVHWQFTGKAYSRRIELEGGREMTLGSLERPQVMFDSEGKPRALFAAVADGPGGFQKAANTWNQVFLLQGE